MEMPQPQKKKHRRRGRSGTEGSNEGPHGVSSSSSVDRKRPSDTPTTPGKVRYGNSSSRNSSPGNSTTNTNAKMSTMIPKNDKGDGVVASIMTPHSTLLIPLTDETEFWFSGLGPITPERNATIALTNKAAATTTITAEHQSTSTTPKSSAQPQQTQPNPMHIVTKYRTMADQIYRNEIMLFNNNNHSKKGNTDASAAAADTSFLEHTIARGTLKDKIAAMSVLVSTYPIHKLYILDSLLSMVGCHTNSATTTTTHKKSSTTTNNSRVIQMAAEALEDLFIHTLLPKDRKLVTLQQRPLLLYENNNKHSITNGAEDESKNGNLRKKSKNKKANHDKTITQRTLSPRILLLWRYEEMIKERYDMFLRYYIARTLSNDIPTSTSPSNGGSTTNHGTKGASTTTINLDGPKIAALRTGAALLRTVPEGETYLLPLLINKLGDPKATICSVTAHELRKILHLHPSMVHIVAREVQQLVHRPHLSMNAIYNCITFLNQLKLVRRAETTKNDADDPYAALAMSLMNTYFRLFDIAIQQPSTPQQHQSHSNKGTTANNTKKETSDIHQSRLLSALLTGVNRAHPYLPTTVVSSSSTNSKNPTTNVSSILDEHMDALYRVVHTAPPAARTQSLLLLFHIAVGNGPTEHRRDKNGTVMDTTRSDRFYRALYATLAEPSMVGTGKHVTMYFNLLYKAMKCDSSETNAVRLMAFTKRLWSTALHCSSSVLAAVIFLIDTIAHDHHPFLHQCYRSVLSERDALRVLDPTKREPRGALVVWNGESNPNQIVATDKDSSTEFEIMAPGWELGLTKFHYHPSVKKFAEIFESDSKGIGNNYTGDPLRDFALAPFLDKFAYRNPKALAHRTASETVTNALDDDDEAPATAMEKYSHSVGARRQRRTDQMNQPLNDPSFIESSTVNEDELFFHKFFVERAKRDSMKGIVRNKNQKSDTNVDDEDAEVAALDRAESRNADQNTVPYNMDDYDTWDQWETDDEEEEFVDSLAQQIIEDSMEGNLVDELDDEDPDTEDWDDLHDEGIHVRPSNDDDEEDNDAEDDNDVEDDDAFVDQDDDAFVDQDDDAFIDQDDDAFMDQDFDSDSSQGEIGPLGETEMHSNDASDDDDDDNNDDDDDEEENAAILLAEGSDDVDYLADSRDDDDDDYDDDDDDDYYANMIKHDDDEEGESDDDVPLLQPVPISGNNGSSDGVFAAADDYAELVEKSWKSQKRHYTSWDEDDDEHQNEKDDDDEAHAVSVRTLPTNTNGSKNKRRKRNRGK